MPKVSIIVNCHNGEKYLKAALDSIYAQDFTDWEVIFFDNASVDRSAAIAKSYDSRLKYYFNNVLIPLGAARREAVNISSGEWIAFLDVDDLWTPNKLSEQLNAVRDSDYVACYAGVRYITESGKKIRDDLPVHKSGELLEYFLWQFDLNMVTPMLKRQVLENYRLNFDPNITASEEYNLFLRVAAKGPILAQQKILGFYRVSASSLTDKQISLWASERRRTLEALEFENPGIRLKYQEAFKEAEARAVYYDARFFISECRFSEAREALFSIKNQDIRYRVLFYISYFPFIWNTIHQRKFFSIISRLKSIVG